MGMVGPGDGTRLPNQRRSALRSSSKRKTLPKLIVTGNWRQAQPALVRQLFEDGIAKAVLVMGTLTATLNLFRKSFHHLLAPPKVVICWLGMRSMSFAIPIFKNSFLGKSFLITIEMIATESKMA
eukprot:1962882-Amphidinium_carterae.1